MCVLKTPGRHILVLLIPKLLLSAILCEDTQSQSVQGFRHTIVYPVTSHPILLLSHVSISSLTYISKPPQGRYEVFYPKFVLNIFTYPTEFQSLQVFIVNIPFSELYHCSFKLKTPSFTFQLFFPLSPFSHLVLLSFFGSFTYILCCPSLYSHTQSRLSVLYLILLSLILHLLFSPSLSLFSNISKQINHLIILNWLLPRSKTFKGSY